MAIDDQVDNYEPFAPGLADIPSCGANLVCAGIAALEVVWNGFIGTIRAIRDNPFYMPTSIPTNTPGFFLPVPVLPGTTPIILSTPTPTHYP